MKKFNVGIIGATGMVGQRFLNMLENHPYFNVTCLAASKKSAGQKYADAVKNKPFFKYIPKKYADLTVLDGIADLHEIAAETDFCFCAVNMPKDEVLAVEEAYARAECPIVSNNSAHRFVPDVPMIIPEINAEHLEAICEQKKRLGTKRGFIVTKCNCSLNSYVTLLHPLRQFGIKYISVCTYQAISGAGKTFYTMPEIVDNLIPYIDGEEQKSQLEPLKIWGRVDSGKILPAAQPKISATCVRVPVLDGHTAVVSVKFERKPAKKDILSAWQQFKGEPQMLSLPTAPKQFIYYLDKIDRPQPKLDRDVEMGMAVCAGRLTEDSVFDYRFIGLSHNTVRGAAGGGILLAELLAVKGYFDR